MSSTFHSSQSKQALKLMSPATDSKDQLRSSLRRRLSSLSLPIASPAGNSWSAFRRSKSACSMSEYASSGSSTVRKWLDWGWECIVSRKPAFFVSDDLEKNPEEERASQVGSNKCSWICVFNKVRSQLSRKLMGSDKVGLPQTFRYDSFDYSKNFDSGER